MNAFCATRTEVDHDPIGVKAILDAFYAKDGHEPDWAAMLTHVYTQEAPAQTLMAVLKVFWAVYEEEDTAAQQTLLWSLLNKNEAWA